MGVRARGSGGCSPPPRLGQSHYFGGRSQQPKMKKMYLLNEKKTSLCLAGKSARNPGFLLIITGWSESGKVIFQVSLAVFSGAVEKFFGQRWLSPPRKNGPYARLWAYSYIITFLSFL